MNTFQLLTGVGEMVGGMGLILQVSGGSLSKDTRLPESVGLCSEMSGSLNLVPLYQQPISHCLQAASSPVRLAPLWSSLPTPLFGLKCLLASPVVATSVPSTLQG